MILFTATKVEISYKEAKEMISYLEMLVMIHCKAVQGQICLTAGMGMMLL